MKSRIQGVETMANAKLKFFNVVKNFGYATSAAGDIFVPGKLVVAAMLPDLLPDAELLLDVVRAERGLQATKIHSVTPPFKVGTIKWFDPAKNFGFIATGEGDVFLHGSVAETAGVLPWAHLPVLFLASTGKDGRLQTTRVKFPSLEAEIAALAGETQASEGDDVVVEAADALPKVNFVTGERMRGVVSYVNVEKGWGKFSFPGSEGELFFHFKERADRSLTPAIGMEFDFIVGSGPKGFVATSIVQVGALAPLDVSLSAEAQSTVPVEKPVRTPRRVVHLPMKKRVAEGAGGTETAAPAAELQKVIRRRVALKAAAPASEGAVSAGNPLVLKGEVPNTAFAAALIAAVQVAKAASKGQVVH
ncbi:MAG: hypothetical protein AUK16_03195 [Parcubacteria group bacterium CG2_30_44_11]|nr:MAG: hypothetical protein AUK16_03195 [Parcubacteria group bacterium CG2_30_44_11]